MEISKELEKREADLEKKVGYEVMRDIRNLAFRHAILESQLLEYSHDSKEFSDLCNSRREQYVEYFVGEAEMLQEGQRLEVPSIADKTLMGRIRQIYGSSKKSLLN